MTFGFLVGSKNFFGLFSVFGKYWFYMGMIVSTVLPSLVPLRQIDDCFAIRFLRLEFCDPRQSSHQNVPLWARLYQYIFCKKPSLFLSSSRYRNLGPSESPCRHCAYPEPIPFLVATPLVIHEKNLEVLWSLGAGPNFLWNRAASPTSLAMDRIVLRSVLHLYYCFRFLLVYAAGFTAVPHSYFHFFLVLDFRCICWLQIRNPVMKMMTK